MPHLHGMQCKAAKLSNADVTDIRRDYSPGVVSMASLAERYGVTRGAVSRIINGQTWRHLEVTRSGASA